MGNCIVLVIPSPLVSKNTGQMIDLITAGMNFPSKSGILMKHVSAHLAGASAPLFLPPLLLEPGHNSLLYQADHALGYGGCVR